MSRVLLINLQHPHPEREDIELVDRVNGDMFLATLGLEYGGYIVADQEYCLAAQWMVPDEKLKSVVDFLKSNSLEGYDAQVFARELQPNGSMDEVRVL